MAGADTSGPYLEELAQCEELIQEREEAPQEDDAMKQESVREKEEEELSKREPVPEKPDKEAKRNRASAAGSSSPPRQPPPPGPATHIHKLPDEVLGMIFAPLNLKTIASVISVCQRWRAVVEDRYLNKELVLEDSKVTKEEALSLIHYARKLKSLELIWCSDAVALLDAASARWKNLLHLSVDFCKPFFDMLMEAIGRGELDDSSIPLTEALIKFFQTTPHITNLRLKYKSTAENLRFFQELGALLPDLCKLEFNIVGSSHLELHAVIDSCSRNKMEEFKAPIDPCSDAHIAKLVQFWGSSLRVLELDAGRLTDGALAQLGGCSELRRLKLLNLSTPGDWLCGLAALSHLEELDVAIYFSAEIAQEKWCHFFSHSRCRHKLLKLSLRGWCGVDDTVLSSVAAFCPQLEELGVSVIYATISGVREVLRGCSKLHNLDVFNPNSSLLQIVGELPQLAPQLRRIGIGDEAKRSLGKAALRRVRAQMPHLRIE